MSKSVQKITWSISIALNIVRDKNLCGSEKLQSSLQIIGKCEQGAANGMDVTI